ncbi:MAG TPA: PPK2 family polyphosphate kinase [Ktedonobacterales bacterium]|nr:PPK2 family polyphosphate kinase [Ktedonobacterales bacterium]
MTTPASTTIDTQPRSLSLKDYPPEKPDHLMREKVQTETKMLEARLAHQQELLFGAGSHSVLIVLQGMDTAGKDGTIKQVMSAINPTGCHVWSFKVPTADELAHDFLWRIHRRTPERGMMAIFNRSHYEDVLVPRVHKLAPRAVWQARYGEINAFEQMLTNSGVIVLKFFLHISKDEQKRRLLAREQEPNKSWKLAVGDWQERAFWSAYTAAYEDALARCGTSWAPWHIVPADAKWYRNYAVARTIVERLEPYERGWERTLVDVGKQRLHELEAAHIPERATAEK